MSSPMVELENRSFIDNKFGWKLNKNYKLKNKIKEQKSSNQKENGQIKTQKPVIIITSWVQPTTN